MQKYMLEEDLHPSLPKGTIGTIIWKNGHSFFIPEKQPDNYVLSTDGVALDRTQYKMTGKYAGNGYVYPCPACNHTGRIDNTRLCAYCYGLGHATFDSIIRWTATEKGKVYASSV
jgi:hypothetical protein